jgi:hypothetical protein
MIPEIIAATRYVTINAPKAFTSLGIDFMQIL